MGGRRPPRRHAVVAETRKAALTAARAAIAAVLEVDPESFDLEARYRSLRHG